jgi:outer membrane protein OmpA-like peptidoglycan-associated protein
VQRQLTTLPKLEFASRMSTLLPRSRASVLRAARILKANPGLRIRIEGYTDNLGSTRVNRELSAARAEVVRLTLIHAGVAANRLQVAWFGESRPLVPNTSATYRARNRRVELVVLP